MEYQKILLVGSVLLVTYIHRETSNFSKPERAKKTLRMLGKN
jgi:hypothetical protein